MIALPSSIEGEARLVIEDAFKKLSMHPFADKIYLYGSYAVGKQNSDSDIDMAVFLKHGVECSLDIFKEMNKLVISSEFDIQLQVFGEDELSDPCGIIEEIVSFGILLN